MPAPNPYPALVMLRDKLAAIHGIATCKIGLEPNITAADYPIIRIVPSLHRPSEKVTHDLQVIVYFGDLIHNVGPGDLEEQYAWLFEMEAQIKDASISSGVRCAWIETMADEDRLPGYKLFAALFRLECFRALR